jgi:hypothetical protein
MSDALRALIARVEAASGPSRELDEAIYGACWALSALWEECDRDEQAYQRGIGRYSESLDAALSLVPGGWDWMMGNVAGAILASPNGCDVAQSSAATPALALTAAALRARLAMEEQR